MSTCCKLRAVQSEQMASASWEVFFFTCSSWAAWITGSVVATAPLWYRFFPLSHSSNWLMLYLKWHQWDRCYIQSTSWRYNKAMDLHGFDQSCTGAACQYSTSRHPCAAAGCWGSLHWWSRRAGEPPAGWPQGLGRGQPWWCETVPAAWSGPVACSPLDLRSHSPN